MEQNPQIASLFGWGEIAKNVPPKVQSIDHLFQSLQQQNQQLALCVDCSGSTLYNNKLSHNGKTFSQIYIEAMFVLQSHLPANHKVIAWSSTARELLSDTLQTYQNAVNNKIPFTDQILGMNGGTSPQYILPWIQNHTSIIVTDGDIGDSEISTLQQKVATSNIGNVFLVIIPHIDSYGSMYSNDISVEKSAKDNIKLSIPRAFANKLATVIIWNFRKQAFELIPELTAPWINFEKPILELLSNPIPTAPNGHMMVKCDNHHKTFVLDKLCEWLSNNNVDESIIEKLISMNIKGSIRQQGTAAQRDTWNGCMHNIFNKILNQKIKEELQSIPIPEDALMLEKIKISVKNEREQKRIENVHRQRLGKLFGEQLLIDKVVSELTNIMAAKTAQTAANVAKFQTMETKDKLSEIAPCLLKDECSICLAHTHVFSTVSIPTKLLLEMKLSGISKNSTSKKGKTTTVTYLHTSKMRKALEENPPKLHFLKFCSECGTKVLDDAHAHDDPTYGITKIVPQNEYIDEYGNKVMKERLLLLPLVSPNMTSDGFQPNDSKLSFARQWLRGFISATVGVLPAERDCLIGSLMFLTALATNKEHAIIIFGNQKSLLSGGVNNNYASTVGRLFAPSSKSISSDTLMLISLVQNVIDIAEIPVLPDSNKLLLLCMIEKKMAVLLMAKNKKQHAMNNLDILLQSFLNGANHTDNNFNITNETVQHIKTFSNIQEYKDTNQESIIKCIAYYLQKVDKLDMDYIQKQEVSLVGALNATNVTDMALALNIEENHLAKMIERSNLTPEEFVILTSKVINEFAISDDKYTNILLKFI